MSGGDGEVGCSCGGSTVERYESGLEGVMSLLIAGEPSRPSAVGSLCLSR